MLTTNGVIAGMKYVVAAAFCHLALGMSLSSAALLALLVLHPLSLCLFILISVNALVSTTSVDKAIGIGVPIGVLILLAWISSDRQAEPSNRAALPARA